MTIYIRLSGRIGNHLFQMAAGASLAHRIKANFKAIIAPDSEPISKDNHQSMASYLIPLQSTIFQQIEFVTQMPQGIPTYAWHEFQYKPIPQKTTDIIIDGYFQSYLYHDTYYVQQIFSIPTEIRDSLNKKYTWITRPFISINVRRGDYLKLPHRFSICSMKYFRTAMKQFDSQQLFVIISDDINWCKKHFKGNNIVFADKNSGILEDLYLQTFAQGNIISNSSFSWWGAYLNSHPDKKVYYPTPWFGPHNSHHDTSDLCPPSWVAIPNQTPLYYRLKSAYLRIKMKFQ